MLSYVFLRFSLSFSLFLKYVLKTCLTLFQVPGVVSKPPGSPQASSGINALVGGKLRCSDILGSMYYTLQVFMVKSNAIPKVRSG